MPKNLAFLWNFSIIFYQILVLYKWMILSIFFDYYRFFEMRSTQFLGGTFIKTFILSSSLITFKILFEGENLIFFYKKWHTFLVVFLQNPKTESPVRVALKFTKSWLFPKGLPQITAKEIRVRFRSSALINGSVVIHQRIFDHTLILTNDPSKLKID